MRVMGSESMRSLKVPRRIDRFPTHRVAWSAEVRLLPRTGGGVGIRSPHRLTLKLVRIFQASSDGSHGCLESVGLEVQRTRMRAISVGLDENCLV